MKILKLIIKNVVLFSFVKTVNEYLMTQFVIFQGWWKGELDGRIGVFPDNFVKLLSANTVTNQNSSNIAEKQKVGNKMPSSEVRFLNHLTQ